MNKDRSQIAVLGQYGEDVACNYLINKGYQIEGRNINYKNGEIDIVAKKGKSLHFVEVKTRKKSSFMKPFEAINYFKVKKIKAASKMYLSDRKYGYADRDYPECHFDVISIEILDGSYNLEFIEDAFE